MDLIKRIIGIILVAAVVTALVLLVVGFIRSRTTKTQTTVTTTTNEVIPAQPTVVNTNTTAPEPIPQTGESKKTLSSVGSTFSFPNTWGVLSCTNSANFELDPISSGDNRVNCDVAQKPITVLINSNLACKGQPATIGNMSVTKYRVENVRGVDYQWCFSKNGVNYNITHRVSAAGVRGTSAEDYSGKVEEMIGAVK